MLNRWPRFVRQLSPQHMVMAVAALALFISLARYAFVYHSELLFTVVLAPLGCMVAAITLFYSDARRQRAFRLLLYLLVWTFVCAVINERRGESLLANQPYLYSLVITVCLCFPLAGLLGEKRFRTFLYWAAGVTMASRI